MCDQELERILKKLVRDRRTAASSITAEKERADHTEETQEKTKCDFQIEQLTKIKNTEGKYQESCTNVETPNTKQKVAKGSQNNEDNNITQYNQQNKLPVPVATEQKELEALKLCKTEIKQKKRRTQKTQAKKCKEGMQQDKQKQNKRRRQKQLSKNKDKTKGQLNIADNQQKNTEKQGKSRKEREEQEKITDTSNYTEPQPQQDYKNHQAITRIKDQNEVGTVEKENLEIEKQKPHQKPQTLAIQDIGKKTTQKYEV